ncbi:hypothetical protein MJN39_24475, partial [Salmonella enterica subsp. enterica serovar Kentucky]|nr:hypothetical protein [Salmonella enterica subsp. enterica serovar Kentucky]
MPYGAFGEIFWDAQCQEMQQLASRVIACRKPSQRFKYRYEFNETWGMLGSFTATRNEMENYTWKEGKLHKNGSDSV